jgi:hypothetical protein
MDESTAAAAAIGERWQCAICQKQGIWIAVCSCKATAVERLLPLKQQLATALLQHWCSTCSEGAAAGRASSLLHVSATQQVRSAYCCLNGTVSNSSCDGYTAPL